MNKKITTIDDLAVMIGKESRANEKRFDVLERRFDTLEGKFSTMEGRMDGMATKQDLFKMEARIMAKFDERDLEIKNHDSRILALENIVKP